MHVSIYDTPALTEKVNTIKIRLHGKVTQLKNARTVYADTAHLYSHKTGAQGIIQTQQYEEMDLSFLYFVYTTSCNTLVYCVVRS